MACKPWPWCQPLHSWEYLHLVGGLFRQAKREKSENSRRRWTRSQNDARLSSGLVESLRSGGHRFIRKLLLDKQSNLLTPHSFGEKLESLESVPDHKTTYHWLRKNAPSVTAAVKIGLAAAHTSTSWIRNCGRFLEAWTPPTHRILEAILSEGSDRNPFRISAWAIS